MADIKIFVSHRIDIDSELIGNPLYVPVRCGAVFDRENPMGIAGDDTGDNISGRRMSFCEFTVQYWAWKNAQADYYGLCHYRRYLSFSGKRYCPDENGMVFSKDLTAAAARRYGLLDAERMRAVIEDYDVITSECAPVERIPTPGGKGATVADYWQGHVGVWLERETIELLFQLIDEMAPEYSRSAREYFASKGHRGLNCYVLRKELFERLCRLQFPIMFEAERRINTDGYTQTMKRAPAFIGEMLYGIFLYHVTTYENWRVKELQLVYFQNTERFKGPGDRALRWAWRQADRALRAVVDPICPMGSRRREALKEIFYTVTPARRRGMANITGACDGRDQRGV